MKVAIVPLVLSTATLGLIFGVAQNAQAALITGVTASTNMGSQGNSNINNTVNGAGLPSNTPSLTGNHAASQNTGANANAWESQQNTTTGTITFNLNSTYNLNGFSFWNLSGTGQTRNRGINSVTIKSSTDGINFTPIPNAPTSFNQGANNNNSQPPQIVTFSSPVLASYVMFDVLSNFGTPPGPQRTGFSEVQFNGTPIPIPEPSSLLALLAFGLAGVGFRKRM